jgi:hypothetical protein
MTTDDLRQEGYDKEEHHFKEQEHKALQQMRAKLEEKRRQQADANTGKEFYLRCCRCGGKMTELTIDNIVIDKCESCGGIYLDAGELDLLLKSHQPQSVWATLGSLLGRS